MMIQKYLIQYILSPLGGLMDKLSEKNRDRLFVLGGLGVMLMYFSRNMSLATYRFVIFFAIDCVFLGLMILSTLRKDMKPVKFRLPLAVFWFGVGVCMLLSGLINSVDYLPEALLFLVVYPVMFLCWNNADRSRIFRLLLRISRISLIIFIVSSLLLAKIDAAFYSGIFNNTNGAAYYLAVTLGCLLLELLYEKKFGVKLVLDILLLGLGGTLLYYTNSRTGPLAIFVAGGAALVLYALTHPWKDSARRLVRIGAAYLAVLAFSASLVYVLQFRQTLDLPFFDPATGQLHGLIEKMPWYKPGDPIPGMEGVVPEDIGGFDISQFHTFSDSKTSTEDKTLDQYSTGRISIWLHYAQELNWTGHGATEPFYLESLYKYISSTHMTILQVAYESGIVAGIFYLLLNLGTGLVSIWFAWKHRKEQYALMPLVITLIFGIMSMLGSCAVSLWYMTTWYYYLVQFPILVKDPKKIQ